MTMILSFFTVWHLAFTEIERVGSLIDPMVVVAIAQVESSFDACARGRRVYGLLQMSQIAFGEVKQGQAKDLVCRPQKAVQAFVAWIDYWSDLHSYEPYAIARIWALGPRKFVEGYGATAYMERFDKYYREF